MNSAAHAPSSTSIPLPDAVTVLARHGYRLTGPRRVLLATVLEKDRPFTAEQLVTEQPDIGRATIYRTLEILASVDLLTRLLQPGGHPAYVVGLPGHRHHLVCSECGTVVAFTNCPMDQLLRQLSRETSFAISSHHLEITGICPGCQSAPSRPVVVG
jgi:Fur family ferric uptake transcriptional regulator